MASYVSGSVHAAQAAALHASITPQGHTDNRTRAPGSGYAGGPTATSAKGVPADTGAGKVSAPVPPPKHAVGPINMKA